MAKRTAQDMARLFRIREAARRERIADEMRAHQKDSDYLGSRAERIHPAGVHRVHRLGASVVHILTIPNGGVE